LLSSQLPLIQHFVLRQLRVKVYQPERPRFARRRVQLPGRATLAGRVEELEARLAGVRKRREEIQDELERETVREPSQADLRGAINAIAEAMENGNPSQRKALLQELVAEIRVESREAIFPTYRLPNGPVRVISGVVGRSLYNANRQMTVAAPRIVL